MKRLAIANHNGTMSMKPTTIWRLAITNPITENVPFKILCEVGNHQPPLKKAKVTSILLTCKGGAFVDVIVPKLLLKLPYNKYNVNMFLDPVFLHINDSFKQNCSFKYT